MNDPNSTVGYASVFAELVDVQTRFKEEWLDSRVSLPHRKSEQRIFKFQIFPLNSSSKNQSSLSNICINWQRKTSNEFRKEINRYGEINRVDFDNLRSD